VTHRKLLEPIQLYRIGDPRGEWPVFSGEGSRKFPGRWNDGGQNMIYLSEHLATSMLEKIIRLHSLPPNQHYVEIAVPAGCSYEEVNPDTLPGWFAEDQVEARRYGAKWFDECRSLLLYVPSVVTRVEKNVLVNPHHDHFDKIKPGREVPVYWDKRLFGK
jgi:RES domain-containing protein